MFDSRDWGVGAVWVWDGEYGEVGWDFGGDYCGISDFRVVGVGVEALSVQGACAWRWRIEVRGEIEENE